MTSDEDLAVALRALAEALHQTEADPARRVAAHGLLQRAHQQLADGERRLRWYERDAESRARPARNRDLSAWSGRLNAAAPPMTLEVAERGGVPAIVGSVRLTRLREGPPGHVHGGVIAGLFDEVMGAAQRLGGGEGGMTGRLSIRYRRPTPLDADIEFRAWIHQERPRRMIIRAEAVVVAVGTDTDADTLTATAEALFVRPQP